MAIDRSESESIIPPNSRGSSKKHYVWICVFSLLIISIVTAGVLYYFLSVEKEEALDESDQDKTIGQCSDVDFENMFSSKSERTRKCLQSWYDYKWKCSCTYNCSDSKKSIRKKCIKSGGDDAKSCCKYSYCKKSIRCSG